MKVAIAMDSFKGNLSSSQVAALAEAGLRRVYSHAQVKILNVADGGEGTTSALLADKKGEYRTITVLDPLGRPIKARYCILSDGTAVMEMAAASGICLLKKEEYNPMITSTYGTGQLIADALACGCRNIIMGIGGSATNDGGSGMAHALGVRFLDRSGKELSLGGGGLDLLDRIDISQKNPALKDLKLTVACDVDNPLCGPTGASYVFGKQKGATAEMQAKLDENLAHYANVIQRDLGISIQDIPGSGAAGGLGGGLVAFCNAGLQKGIDVILDTLNADAVFSWADVVITGEGRIDGQTVHGKVPAGVARRAKQYGKPVFAIAGFANPDASEVYTCGIDAVISSMVGPMSLEEAIFQSPRLIEEASERLFRIIRCFSKE